MIQIVNRIIFHFVLCVKMDITEHYLVLVENYNKIVYLLMLMEFVYYVLKVINLKRENV